MAENKQSIELKLVAAFFFVIGVYGTFNTIISFPVAEDLLQILFAGFLIVIFGLTALSGYFIFVENDKGLEYARAIAALQIVHFQIGGIGFYFVTGAYAFVGLIMLILVCVLVWITGCLLMWQTIRICLY